MKRDRDLLEWRHGAGEAKRVRERYRETDRQRNRERERVIAIIVIYNIIHLINGVKNVDSHK